MGRYFPVDSSRFFSCRGAARDCLGLSGWMLQDNLTVIFVRFQWEGLALEGFSCYRYLSNKLEKTVKCLSGTLYGYTV